MTKILLISLVVFLGFVFIKASLYQTQEQPIANPQQEAFAIPQNIQDIVDNSCIGCHKSDSKNDKAKKKLMFDKLNELSEARLVGRLSGISEEIIKGEMPPKKVVADHPEIALSAENAKTLSEWALNTANSYLK
ncbi:MAG: heme-binding domain-containing protein [Bacteroidales bacterium]|nr:heme-binding domain-containing protein [Bacteroidales bacterium]